MRTRENFLREVERAINARLPGVRQEVRAGLHSDVAFLAVGGVEAANTPVVTVPVVSKFVLSQRSLEVLATVKPELRKCVELAIRYTAVDFRVNQGARTLAQQKQYVAAGTSRTMRSKHLPQADGTAWAVDLVAIVDGTVSWQFDLYADIAFAMDRAATELGIAKNVRWGCAWDRVLSDFGGSKQAYLDEAKAYAKRHAGSDLLDGPHFEWVA